MACCDTCACLGQDYECLSVVDPANFGFFAEWCRGDDSTQRRHVRNRSEIAARTGNPAPGLLQKAASFASAVVTHVSAGMPRVDPPTFQSRLDLCQACPHSDAAQGACNLCGCNLAVKLWWADQACPIGKWPAQSA